MKIPRSSSSSWSRTELGISASVDAVSCCSVSAFEILFSGARGWKACLEPQALWAPTTSKRSPSLSAYLSVTIWRAQVPQSALPWQVCSFCLRHHLDVTRSALQRHSFTSPGRCWKGDGGGGYLKEPQDPVNLDQPAFTSVN